MRTLFITQLIVLLSMASCKTQHNILSEGSIDSLQLSEEQLEKVSHENQFTLDFFRISQQDAKSAENIFLSPLSASMVLSMTASGAQGTTLQEMQKALGYGNMDQAQVNSYYQTLISSLGKLSDNTQIELANSLWYDKNFKVKKSFKDTSKQYYLADATALDFNSPEAKNEINSWVERSTHGKITEMIDDIPAQTSMYLINALYFKGMWSEPFKEQDTRAGVFHLQNKQTVQADFMNITHDFKYYQDQKAQILEMPYGKGSFSMVFMLPNEGSSPQDLLQGMDSASLEETFSALHKRKLAVSVPKFKFSYQKELIELLKSIGMQEAFSPNADFSNLSDDSRTYIDEVLQKAFVEVNEEGTEAAAATSVGIALTSMPMIEKVELNRPFIFMIKENSSNLILFMGTLADPTQK